MLDSGSGSGSKASTQRLIPCLFSCICVFCTQLLLYLVARIGASLSLLSLLLISAFLLLGGVAFGGSSRRLLGISASAPAFVLFSTMFLWGVYLAVVREGTSPLNSLALNFQFVLLLTGLHRILNSDPGVVTRGYSCLETSDQHELSKDTFLFGRVRYCKICKRHVKGFDHHCPAFGNCIGQDNQILFMTLLFAFVIAEASYVMCSTKFVQRSQNMHSMEFTNNLQTTLAVSTMIFCLLQVLWQVLFLMWHIYCVCFNIKTDEWINWRKYPEFQAVVETSQGGQPILEVNFINPYYRGVLKNISEFLGISYSSHVIHELPS